MTLETVDSSAIHALGYNGTTHVLEIIFASGGIYHFTDVPSGLYRRMLRTTSKGRFFQEHIRGRYRFKRLDRPRRRSTHQLALGDS